MFFHKTPFRVQGAALFWRLLLDAFEFTEHVDRKTGQPVFAFVVARREFGEGGGGVNPSGLG